MMLRQSLLCATALMMAAAATVPARAATTGAVAPSSVTAEAGAADSLTTATPIKHLVVIFDENVSFDHYFGTYPTATNPAGEPRFTALPGTLTPNDLVSANLLTNNPNSTNTANGAGAANPFRLDRTQAETADQNHAYTAEQEAYDSGKADAFPAHTGSGTSGGAGAFGTTGQVLGYYDGNTVTALWNYAQYFAMNDNSFGNTYGPSTPGAVEVVSGNTDGLSLVKGNPTGDYVTNTVNGKTDLTMMGDVDPGNDVCSSTTTQASLTGKNIGDLLNAADITWGGFMGGVNLGLTNAEGNTGCKRTTMNNVAGAAEPDYVPHHNWFQYFPSTANPTHARPQSVATIGYSFDSNGAADPANHEYDLNDFKQAIAAGNFPAVSYIKLVGYQDGHAGYSDPLDEQNGIVTLVNLIETQPDWSNTAIIIAYDDSDGWYDHQYATPTSSSFNATADQLNGAGVCGTGTQPTGLGGAPVNGRCGPGPRLPFLVISPYARPNYIDHTQISQASVVSFIEDNWLGGERLGGGSFDAQDQSLLNMFDFTGTTHTKSLILNPTTGTVVSYTH